MTATPLIPTLETERLLLRGFTPEDLDPFTALVSDPEVMSIATYSGNTMTKAQADNWMCMMLGHWHLRGFGIWAVEEKSSRRLIGRIGLQRLVWFTDVELVWMLARSAWGKGYATEGAAAAAKFGFQELDLPQISAVIRQDNLPSIRLAERLGMELVGDLEREGILFVEYMLSAPGSHPLK